MRSEQRGWEPPDGSAALDAWVVTHGAAQMVIVPERGGKLVSLRHLPTGTEWLWLNPHLGWRPADPTESYVQHHDLGGWDECFPTIAPTTVAGVTWPDHGDVWWRRWESALENDGLWMGTEGVGYRFERTIRPMPEGFRLDYAVSNLGKVPLPYLWCAHPLLCTQPPLELELAGRPRIYLGNRSALGEEGERHRWPTIAERTLQTVGKPSGLAAKLFVEVETGEATLCHPGGATLSFRWPVEVLPILGLWLNEEGWSGAGSAPYCNLGVEPATGAPDDLAVALNEWGSARLLPPGARHEWWVELGIGG